MKETGPPGSTPLPAGGRLAYIDGLRGLAILMVILIHIWNRTGRVFNHWWNPVASGYIGVDLFLILSGFCLYWPMVRPGGREPGLREFALRRARRILPPYYVALAICTAGALLLPAIGHTWPEAPDSPESILVTGLWHAAMLHNLRPEHISALNGPFWSLALEVSFYVAMPILVVVARRHGMIRAMALAAFVSLTYRLVLEHAIGSPGWRQVGANSSFVLCWSLPGKWVEFAAGMWAAEIVSRGKLIRLPLGVITVTGLAGGAIWSQCAGAYHPLCDLFFGIALFCLVLLGSQGQEERASRALRWRPLVWLGTISYSVYLIHLPMLAFAFRLPVLDRSAWPIQFAICLVGVLPVTLGVAFLFHLTFERPFMNRAVDRAPRALASAGLPGRDRVVS